MEKVTIDQSIFELINCIKAEIASRESALAITKLQEALYWYREHEDYKRSLSKGIGSSTATST